MTGRRRCLLAALLFLLLALTGCWDRIEINDLAVVKVVGIDKTETGIRLSVRLVIPSKVSREGSQMFTMIHSAEGDTILEATSRLQEQVSRRIFWGHAGPLMISEDLARQGLGGIMDFWARHREPRPNMLVTVVQGSALDFLQATPQLERILAESVRELLNTRLQVRVPIKDFLIMLGSATEHPVLPLFEPVFTYPGSQQLVVRLKGTAVFRRDRMIGILEGAEAQGLLFLRDEAGTGEVTLDLPTGGKVALRLIRNRTDVRPVTGPKGIRMDVSIHLEADAYEVTDAIDMGKEETIRALDRLLQAEIKRRVMGALDLVQHQFRVDVIRFGDAVRRNAPVLWDQRMKANWDRQFPTLPVTLSVNAHIRRTGKVTAPLGMEKGTVKETTRKLLK